MAFNKKMFLEANVNVKDGGDFTEYPDGFYECTLTNASIGKTRNTNKDRVLFKWVIDETHEDYPGNIIYDNINLVGNDGPNEYGYKNLITKLIRFGFSHEQVEEFADNVETLLEKMIGSVVRLKLKTNDKGYQNIYLERVLESSIEGDDELELDISDKSKKPVEEEEVEVTPGMEVIVDDLNLKRLAKIIETDEENGKIMVRYSDKNEISIVDSENVYLIEEDEKEKKEENSGELSEEQKEFLTKQGITEANDEDEIIEEDEDEVIENEDEDEEIDLEVGMNVKGKTKKGNEYTGTIVSIDEENGNCVIKTSENKKYRIKLETLELIN